MFLILAVNISLPQEFMFRVINRKIEFLLFTLQEKFPNYGVFSGPYFPVFRPNTEKKFISFTLYEMCPNTEFFQVHKVTIKNTNFFVLIVSCCALTSGKNLQLTTNVKVFNAMG